jgi:hypothetical protein
MSPSPSLTALLAKLTHEWTAEAERLRERYGLEDLARLCEAHVREVNLAIERGSDEILTLKQGARESGYSISHLRTLLTTGQMTNVGRSGAPRILRSELPPKRIEQARGRRRRQKRDGRFDARKVVGSAMKRLETR